MVGTLDVNIATLLPDFPGVEDNHRVKEVYRLEHDLRRILQKINSVKVDRAGGMPYYLRQNGIEIRGTYGNLRSPIGMLTSGAHIRKEESDLYLVTFQSTDEEFEFTEPSPNLVDLLREFIA